MMASDRRDSLNVLDRAIDGLMEAIEHSPDCFRRKPGSKKEPRKCRSPRTSRSPS